jgi:phosphotransferase system enzyme I (PtsP)
MLEVPSLAEMLDQLLPRVDFLSIGTNDLTQFLFAADRADPRLAERYDWLSPAILRFLKRVLDAARAPACRSGSAARWAAGRWKRWR